MRGRFLCRRCQGKSRRENQDQNVSSFVHALLRSKSVTVCTLEHILRKQEFSKRKSKDQHGDTETRRHGEEKRESRNKGLSEVLAVTCHLGFVNCSDSKPPIKI